MWVDVVVVRQRERGGKANYRDLDKSATGARAEITSEVKKSLCRIKCTLEAVLRLRCFFFLLRGGKY